MTPAKGKPATRPTRKPTPADDQLLTVDEIAQQLRLSRMTVYRLIHRGEIPRLRVGRSYRIPKSELQAYVTRAAAPSKKEE